MEFSLLYAAVIALGAGWAALRWEAARGNAVDCSRDLWDVLIGAAVVGLLVGRLAAMVGAGINPLTSPGDILIVRGGVATGPAALGALFAVAAFSRTEAVTVADALAVAALATLGGWHLACPLTDSCLGTTTQLPWAMTIEGGPGSSVGRHPVELYTAAILLLAAGVLALFRKRRLAPGFAAGLALSLAAAARLATEPLRLSISGGPVWWYAAGIVVGVGAVITAVRRRPS